MKIDSPKGSFFGVARWFDFTNFITEKKVIAICRAVYRNVLYPGLLNCGYFLEPVARN